MSEAASVTANACPTGARATVYTYPTTPGSPFTVTDPNNQVTTYNYDTNGSFIGIRRHGSSADNLTITYHPGSGKVASLTSAGRTRTYNYQITDTPWPFASANTWTEVTDGAGQVTRTEFNGPLPSSIRDPLLRTTTMQYTGSQGHLLQRRTEPEGNAVQHGYDTRDNMTETRRIARPGSGLADLVATSSFPSSCANQVTCNLPSSATDARGNTTDFTYDPVHGGLLTETGPAPAVGAPRPQTRHQYAQRYAWVSNGAGGYVPAATPVWVRTATSTCRTSAATGNPASPCATSGDEVRTTYDYGPDSGPNNLLPRGTAVTADGTTLRTCFTYDATGNRISETGAGAQLGQCQ